MYKGKRAKKKKPKREDKKNNIIGGLFRLNI
jgi:hypothetical protein